jgi:Na+/H+ antiporter NhaD/arsenite permease-like protein
MQSEVLIALAVFLITYVLISIRKFRWFNIERPAVALLGAALMILLGVVTPEEAIGAIDLNTLALLLGMMILVASLELCGFFTWISLRIISASKNQFQFLILIMVSTAVLSALILNDTVVLLFTPIIIKTCRLIKANPIPFMVAEAVSANIGSVATPVGNPQNAYIATQSGISFLTFSAALLPVAALSMLVAIAIIWLVFKKDLVQDLPNERKKELDKRWSFLRHEISKPVDRESAKNGISLDKFDRSVWLVLGVLFLVIAGFLLGPVINLPLAIVAFIGGSAVLFLLPLVNSKISARRILKRVDWTLLLFFIGLFIVLKGVEVSGLMADMIDAFQRVSGGALDTIPGLSIFTAILSNLISNVPAVMLLAPYVAAVGSTSLWLALAASSTLAGNATILGAAANVIVAETGEKMGVELSFWKFVKAGLPITIITLFISIVMLQSLP